MTLTIDDFPGFFEAVNGFVPFSWQERAVREVYDRIDSGSSPCFPSLFDLPTGSGKTSLIDIAVFLLALEGTKEPKERSVPRRIVFVVDRRVVVDQAHEHGCHLVGCLASEQPADPIVGKVAAALRNYAVDSPSGVAPPPMLATVLRGGIVRDEQWARRPDVPTVITSTVDQVGSRLLFRGYGLSKGMQPIHAGLLGADTLFLLDEVHLARPFADTLKAIRGYQDTWPEVGGPRRWNMCELSATPGTETDDAFSLESVAELDPVQDAVLVRRLVASKPVELPEPVKVSGTDRGKANHDFATALVDAAEGHRLSAHVRNVAIVVNRVDTAVATHKLLDDRRDEGGPEAVLLTGRMRPWDRDRIVSETLRHLTTRSALADNHRAVTVVATQCIEAGADLDFDALVTEAASIDALIQRFGRVDRGGVLADADTPAPGSILVRSTDVKGDDDPVYGASMANTWHALRRLDAVDFGFDRLPGGFLGDPLLRAKTQHAPLLFPGHLDSWVQTSPRPDPDPDPKFWLHGDVDADLDVTIVWRADLTRELLKAATAQGQPDEDEPTSALLAVRQLVVAAPPCALESVAVPLSAARAWLRGGEAVAVADVDAPGVTGYAAAKAPDRELAVRFRGDESEVVSARGRRGDGHLGHGSIRPGDILMVPSNYGGLGNHGSWDVASEERVTDLTEVAQATQRRRVVLRITDGTMTGWKPEQGEPHEVRAAWDGVVQDLAEPTDPDVSMGGVLGDWIGANLHRLEPGPREAALLLADELAKHGGELGRIDLDSVHWVPEGSAGAHWFVASMAATPAMRDQIVDALAGDPRQSGEDGEAGGGASTVDSEPETSSFTAVEVPLDDHLCGVGAWADALARNCGLSAELVQDVHLAGRLHDLGKADPRFQVMLHRGDVVAAAGSPLAKSSIDVGDLQARRRARRDAGYPRGARHELLSLAMIGEVDAIRDQAHDWDLVQHLVSSHHGYCRPFAPAVRDDTPVIGRHDFDGRELSACSAHGLERLDSGVADRFWRLVRRYGWHGLAYYEAILRLADHRRSQQEQTEVSAHAQSEDAR